MAPAIEVVELVGVEPEIAIRREVNGDGGNCGPSVEEDGSRVEASWGGLTDDQGIWMDRLERPIQYPSMMLGRASPLVSPAPSVTKRGARCSVRGCA